MGIPPHLQQSLELYVTNGVPPGGFLHALLCNDLKEACSRADDYNRHKLWDIVSYCYNEIPITAWGSPETVKGWLSYHSEKRKKENEQATVKLCRSCGKGGELSYKGLCGDCEIFLRSTKRA